MSYKKKKKRRRKNLPLGQFMIQRSRSISHILNVPASLCLSKGWRIRERDNANQSINNIYFLFKNIIVKKMINNNGKKQEEFRFNNKQHLKKKKRTENTINFHVARKMINIVT